MNAATSLILFIVAIALAAWVAVSFVGVQQEIIPDQTIVLSPAQPEILQVVAYNISNSSANYIRIQVTSDEPVRLNETTITLSETQTATLRYRNGTLTRNVSTGFYTQ